MNQAEVSKLVSKLRMNVRATPRKFRSPKGPEGRMDKLRKTVTGLIKYERIELNHHRGDEARQYTERLISEAIRYGDCHKPTMEVANYWLLEKELIHKLFKVLVPRFENSNSAYTRLLKAPQVFPARRTDKAVLELKGNPYPSLVNNQGHNRLHIQNVLLDAAKHDYRQAKYREIAQSIDKNQKTQQVPKSQDSEKHNKPDSQTSES